MLKKQEGKAKIIVILGPTASDKSDLAVALAKKFNGPARHASRALQGVAGGEVISADSRQVLKGLDIGTGKITEKEMRGVPHHLIDVADPREIFTASDFKNLAEKAIQEIKSKNKIPIICGGTGFYIDALLGDKQIPEVLPNLELRKELEQKTTKELFEILKKLDPERALNIDAKNPRRLVRAIEICMALGQVPKFEIRNTKYEILKIGIAPLTTHPSDPLPKGGERNGKKPLLSPLLLGGGLGVGFLDEKKLKERINRRIEKWLEQGLLEEVEGLHQNGLSWERMSEIGLEYKLVAEYLQNKITKELMIERMQIETHQYAKRQMTWFKKNKDVVWFDPKNLVEIEEEVERFLTI